MGQGSYTFKASTPLMIAVLLALSVLIFLGTWQAQKIAPKTALLQTIERGLSASPIELPVHLDDPQAVLYRRVSFDGVVMDGPPIKVFGTNLAGKPGYSLYLPVVRQHGRTVFVNFGWVPIDLPVLPQIPREQVSISGVLLDSAHAGSFTPANMPENNEWFTANVHEIAAHYGLDSKEYYHFRIFADHTGGPNAFPLGGQVRVNIPNDHFEYMLTWYGLAAGLVGVFMVYSVKRRNT